MKTIVGFCGRAGAGKDTAAKALVSDLDFRKYTFAAPIKDALNSIFGWDPSNWESPEWKETPLEVCFGRTPRYLAQTLGTEWGRNLINQDIWVEIAMRRARESAAPGIVFTDVRFPNEARAIRREGGLVIFLTRFDAGDKPVYLTKALEHESEQGVHRLAELAHLELACWSGQVDRLQRQVLNIVINWTESERRRIEPRWLGRQA